MSKPGGLGRGFDPLLAVRIVRLTLYLIAAAENPTFYSRIA